MFTKEEEKLKWKMDRIKKKISLTEIAKALGCSHAHLSQWENNPDWSMSYETYCAYKEYIESHDNRKR